MARSEKQGKAVRIRVDGWSGEYRLVSEAEEELDEISRGGVPLAWEPSRGSTAEEAVLLAPLERVSAGGRAKQLAGFEYVWEAYKPASKRRWGYYVMPILFEDSLRGRVDLRRDAESRALVVLGFWLENKKDEQNTTFARAFGKALARLAGMNDLDRMVVQAVIPKGFRLAVLETAL